ncbi:MAG: SEC10/PgrA surface exclusion domain-containing protein, partial [Conchiformibius sp.]|nr:SEC10/PgrA surface exclusion domain-containing protein [Conchiformibius sp.]
TGTNPDTGTGTNPNSGSPSDNGVLNGNKIVLPNAYTHNVLQNGNNQQIAQAARGGVEMNRYQSDAEDAKVIIDDLNNLSKNVRVELSQFVAELLNPIREQWGVGKFAVTEGALRFAQDVANEYENNGKSIWDGKGHYDEGIIRAAAKHGLNDGGNFYENMGGHYTEQPLTLDKLKGMVYDTVVQMLFDDAHSQQGHAKSLLNTLAYAEQNKAIDYLGLDTSLIEGKKLSIHFISAADHPVYIKDRSKFDTTPVDSAPAPRSAARLTLSKLLADPADVWDSLPDTDETAYSDHAAATPLYPHEPHFEVM